MPLSIDPLPRCIARHCQLSRRVAISAPARLQPVSLSSLTIILATWLPAPWSLGIKIPIFRWKEGDWRNCRKHDPSCTGRCAFRQRDIARKYSLVLYILTLHYHTRHKPRQVVRCPAKHVLCRVPRPSSRAFLTWSASRASRHIEYPHPGSKQLKPCRQPLPRKTPRSNMNYNQVKSRNIWIRNTKTRMPRSASSRSRNKIDGCQLQTVSSGPLQPSLSSLICAYLAVPGPRQSSSTYPELRSCGLLF